MGQYHTILGVSQTANKDEIKRAYRMLALKHHPDKGGSSAKFIEITEAYNKLINPSYKESTNEFEDKRTWWEKFKDIIFN